MIPTMIILLLRRYRKSHPQECEVLRIKIFSMARIILLTLIAICFFVTAQAQEKSLAYSISRNGSNIGNMKVKEVQAGNTISLRMDTKVKASLVFSFTATAMEEAVYEKGVMVYSSIYQKMNGSEKVNKQTKKVGAHYVIASRGTEDSLHKPIYYNMVCLYTHEPLRTTQIYSDKFQKFLAIETISDHHYRIRFPDGNANEYYYQDGLCLRVKVDHAFYSVTFELSK
jgi:hypothetical protein